MSASAKTLGRRRLAAARLLLVTVVALASTSIWSGGVEAARNTTRMCPAELGNQQGFSDVAPGSVHALGINCIARADITKGLAGGTRYGPDQPVTRGQMATFLRRLLASTSKRVPDGSRQSSDVAGHTHEPAISALQAAGIIPASNPFRPDSPIRRDDMADWMNGTWAWLTGARVTAAGQPFADMAGNPQADDVAGLYVHGVINGKDSGYDPAGAVTRGQMGSFLARLLNMHADAGHIPGVPAVATTTIPPVTVPPVTSPPTTPPTAPPGAGDTASAAALLAHHNAQRAAAGLPPFFREPCLDAFATTWAHQLADAHRLQHRSDFGAAGTAACAPVRTTWGENVGFNVSVEAMGAAFMSSTLHRGNILSPRFMKVGIGAWRDGDGHIWFAVNFYG